MNEFVEESEHEMLCFMQGFEDTASNVELKESREVRLQGVKNRILRKSRSSGNFGSAGARSAPSTPQGIAGNLTEPVSQPCSPGCISPSIQRSPSHNLFSKYDKASLKHLSTSTPAMTAQGQLVEPPNSNPIYEGKKPTTSKARQKKFNRHFPTVDDDEKVLNYYSCALIGDILLQGHLYITKNYFAFHSNVFGYVTKLLIPMLNVVKITKEKTARIIPNAVGIATSEDKHVFGSLISRDSTYKYMIRVWEISQKASEVLVEPEIVEAIITESDSSETREGESGRESPTHLITARIPMIKIPDKDGISARESEVETETSIPASLMGSCTLHFYAQGSNQKEARQGKLERETSLEILGTLTHGIHKFSTISRQSLILFATTFLLILLFLSAAVLLYRIGKIQNKYSFVLQDNVVVPGSQDVYNDLLQWQTHLHSKSAGAIYSFLDSNLDKIAKVRQSLEALSTLLMPNNPQSAKPEANTS